MFMQFNLTSMFELSDYWRRFQPAQSESTPRFMPLSHRPQVQSLPMFPPTNESDMLRVQSAGMFVSGLCYSPPLVNQLYKPEFQNFHVSEHVN